MHSHIIPKNLPDWEKKFGYEGFIRLEHHKPSWANMMQGDNFFREINHNCWDPEIRMNEYEKYATQVQVVCTIPVLFAYFSKPKDGLEVARFLNDDLAKQYEAILKYVNEFNTESQDKQNEFLLFKEKWFDKYYNIEKVFDL